MKKAKAGIFLSSVLALSMVLGACSSDNASTESKDSSAATKDDGKRYVAIISKGFQHQYWQAVKKGAEQAADDLNVKVTFVGPETESQVDKQVEMLRNALDKKPNAIGLAALDSKAVLPLLEQAQSKKIPVVAFDSGVDGDIPVATAATDNKAAAALAADKMAKLIGKKGEVAIVAHDQTSKTGVDRRDGFVDQIKSKYPNIKIVDIQYGAGDQLKSTDAAKAILQAHPKLKGLFGTNEGSAIGVVNAVKELNKKSVKVIGFDSGKLQIDAIKSGVMAGAITQNPIAIGYETVKAAVDTLDGKKVSKSIDTGFFWYDKTNIDDSKIKDVLYE
ncbi:ABC transporter substrate-binding protein [Neobacillus cucumis]|uniref:ABC transporter substrate-binding protein n=1 Tax=Neobacillus cucumis TaxID=1740721 RepID=UPI0028535633|nr:ABC transporter substrate-binding protein [Neobacillus cucumis]MDR4945144.1 ABC transporter substrate-binding protein [Neobacillus cucumis]